MQTLDELLAAHGLAGVTEVPLQNAGYSGSSLSKLVRPNGASFVLKHMSIERDWIMAATDDVACREAAFAELRVVLPDGVRTPNLGIARDGAGQGGHSPLVAGRIGIAQLAHPGDGLDAPVQEHLQFFGRTAELLFGLLELAGHALELLLTGDRIDAERAREIGLAWKVVPRDELLTEAEKTFDLLYEAYFDAPRK